MRAQVSIGLKKNLRRDIKCQLKRVQVITKRRMFNICTAKKAIHENKKRDQG
jgi:hypothetical protein